MGSQNWATPTSIYISFKLVIHPYETNDTTPTELLTVMLNKLQINVKINIVVQLQILNDFGK
jgi:hypothetical protein